MSMTTLSTQRLAKASTRDLTTLWPEPLDTPGYVPQHLKRNATSLFPILEVLQRLLIRFRSRATGHDLEKLLALIGLYQVARPAYEQIKNFCIWAFTVEVMIPEDDPLAKEVLAWMAANVIANNHTRSAMLVTGGVKDTNNDLYRKLVMGQHSTVATETVDEGVYCLPPIGSRLFWVGFRPFIFSRVAGFSSRGGGSLVGQVVNAHGQLPNSLSITTIGWSLKPLYDFTDLCHQFKLENFTGTTTVYYSSQKEHTNRESWQSVQKAIRKFDTIDMNEAVKSDLIKDAEYYYTEKSRQLFADCGIPYRRGYLFHGPPGTGKSSFSAALAGHLRCNIYHISLTGNNLNDSGLHRLFRGLPQKCVVVIEDIDSAGINREGETNAMPNAVPNVMPNATPNMMPPMVQSLPPGLLNSLPGYPRGGPMVTLSGLLNAIDGNASQEGRLLIMTSNKPDSLDPALIRPGRIDKMVYFGNLSKPAGESIFKRLIGRSALAHDASVNMDQIDQYAKEFASKVPDDTFTPAQVQNFLQDCRGDPIKALTDVDAWIEANRPSSPGETPASPVEQPPKANGVAASDDKEVWTHPSHSG